MQSISSSILSPVPEVPEKAGASDALQSQTKARIDPRALDELQDWICHRDEGRASSWEAMCHAALSGAGSELADDGAPDHRAMLSAVRRSAQHRRARESYFCLPPPERDVISLAFFDAPSRLPAGLRNACRWKRGAVDIDLALVLCHVNRLDPDRAFRWLTNAPAMFKAAAAKAQGAFEQAMQSYTVEWSKRPRSKREVIG